MKARIKKGVRPHGGRVFPVLEEKKYPNGREVVILAAGSVGFMGMNSVRQLEYNQHEVKLK